MLTLCGILLFLLSMSAHELGHAFAMKRNGIGIKHISLLGFGTILYRFRWKKYFGKVPLSIKAIPLGASVEPQNSKALEGLPYRIGTQVFGAGVLAQLLFCSVFYIIGSAMQGTLLVGNNPYIIGTLLVLGLFPKYTCHLVMPMGMLFLSLLLYLILRSPSVAKVLNESGSVVMVAQEIHKHTTSLGELLVYASFVSISIAVTNMLPLYPLDGGRIFASLFRSSRWSKSTNDMVGGAVRFVTAIPLLILIYFALKGDILRIWNSF